MTAQCESPGFVHAGAIELLQSGRLPASFWDWAAGADFRFVKDEDALGAEEGQNGGSNGDADMPQADVGAAHGDSGRAADGACSGNGAASSISGADLSSPFVLCSADELKTPFTNYVRGYTGLLDYVWYQPERMRLRTYYPQPPAEELEGWIPSERFPSDHLSVVADLEWLPAEGPDQAPAAVPGQATDVPPAAGPLHADGRTAGDAQPARADGHGSTAGTDTAAGRLSAEEEQQQERKEGSSGRPSAPPRGALLPSDEDGAMLAAGALVAGEVVALPTDTLYGLAACANSEQVTFRFLIILHFALCT